MGLFLTGQFINIGMWLFHLLSYIFWVRLTVNCETRERVGEGGSQDRICSLWTGVRFFVGWHFGREDQA